MTSIARRRSVQWLVVAIAITTGCGQAAPGLMPLSSVRRRPRRLQRHRPRHHHRVPIARCLPE